MGCGRAIASYVKYIVRAVILSELTIGITHADSLAAEAVLAALPELGIDKEDVKLFSSTETAGNRLPFDSHYLVTEDQQQASFDSCGIVMQLEEDEALTQKITDSGSILLKAGGHLCFDSDEGQSLQMDYSQSLYELADPSVFLILKIFNSVKRSASVVALQAVVLQPASSKGKLGVDELAKQTVDLLNARSLEPVLFNTQQAFNVVAQTDDYERQLLAIVGDETSEVQIQTIDVPVFHGMTIVLTMQCDAMLSNALLLNDLQAITGMQLIQDESEIVSPVDSLQENSLASISLVKIEDKKFSCVLTADHYRHAFSENFLNGLSVIRKTFL